MRLKPHLRGTFAVYQVLSRRLLFKKGRGGLGFMLVILPFLLNSSQTIAITLFFISICIDVRLFKNTPVASEG